MQYNCRSPARGYIFRRSLTKKGHFDEYSFPSMFNSPEKLVKLFMPLIFCATLQFQSFTENIAQIVTKHVALLVVHDSQRADLKKKNFQTKCCLKFQGLLSILTVICISHFPTSHLYILVVYLRHWGPHLTFKWISNFLLNTQVKLPCRKRSACP